jgi:hypothetical protein
VPAVGQNGSIADHAAISFNGLDVAPAVLSHSSPDVTEVYLELDEAKAAEATRKVGYGGTPSRRDAQALCGPWTMLRVAAGARACRSASGRVTLPLPGTALTVATFYGL